MLNIEPIQLLKGSHDSTATTGQGCFMNVIAYLNGEPQITDQSPCVCFMVRPMAISLNDHCDDKQRQKLIPFIERAMGSATEDKDVIAERKRLIRAYGTECQQIINDWRAEMKAKCGAKTYAKADADANAYANAYAEAYAYAYVYAYAYAKKLKDALFEAGLRYLDAALPEAQPLAPVVIERAALLSKKSVSVRHTEHS